MKLDIDRLNQLRSTMHQLSHTMVRLTALPPVSLVWLWLCLLNIMVGSLSCPDGSQDLFTQLFSFCWVTGHLVHSQNKSQHGHGQLILRLLFQLLSSSRLLFSEAYSAPCYFIGSIIFYRLSSFLYNTIHNVFIFRIVPASRWAVPKKIAKTNRPHHWSVLWVEDLQFTHHRSSLTCLAELTCCSHACTRGWLQYSPWGSWQGCMWQSFAC